MRIAVAMTKTIPWRVGVEEWSNVYHYDSGSTNVQAAEAGRLVDALKTLEAAALGSPVNFKTGRVWSTGGTPAENQTILIKDLTGSGTMTSTQGIFHEACVVINLGTGRITSNGKRIYLRKYLHPGYLPSLVSGVDRGSAALNSAQKAPFLSYGQGIREVVPAAGEVYRLESPSGVDISQGAAVSVLDYLHTRQFRR